MAGVKPIVTDENFFVEDEPFDVRRAEWRRGTEAVCLWGKCSRERSLDFKARCQQSRNGQVRRFL